MVGGRPRSPVRRRTMILVIEAPRTITTHRGAGQSLNVRDGSGHRRGDRVTARWPAGP
jgi:hypothetical protein